MCSSDLQLVSAAGEELNRNLQMGDYFRIDIPGPGSSAGDGYDWVCVEEIKEVAETNNESIGIRVKPAPNPLRNKTVIAHFYSDEATSNFIITRENSRISAWIIDRNIKPNDQGESVIDKIRDSAAGAGAIGIFSKLQWQGLAEGLIKNGI